MPNKYVAALWCALVAQLDRASDYESEGPGFESLRARHFYLFVCVAVIAQ